MRARCIGQKATVRPMNAFTAQLLRQHFSMLCTPRNAQSTELQTHDVANTRSCALLFTARAKRAVLQWGAAIAIVSLKILAVLETLLDFKEDWYDILSKAFVYSTKKDILELRQLKKNLKF